MSVAQLVSPESKVLIVCAHTDDEFACGGTIAHMVRLGACVRYIALSDCVESVPDGFPSDVLVHECRACVGVLGIPPERAEVHSFPVRHFPARRQEILEMLVQIRRDFEPDLVLLPCSQDTHQDHHTCFEEGFRAFKHASILGYELPQNLISFNNSAFIRLTQEDIDTKVAALSQYKSQAKRPYATQDFIESLARVRGVQCGAPYAEAFELVRMIAF